MKKTIIKALALTLMAALLCLALVACAKTLSGAYEAEVNLGITTINLTYEFKGSKVTATIKSTNFLGQVESVSVDGTYEIAEDEITFTWDKETDGVEGGTFTFEETDKGIKIGAVEFKKADK